MAIEFFTDDVEVIQKLGTHPNRDNGLNEEALKKKFDEAPGLIKKYINEKLVPAIASVFEKFGTGDFVKYDPQTLTSEQQAQARENIDALKVPRGISRELFWSVDENDFQTQENLNVFKFNEVLGWLQSPEDFDFRIRFALRTSIATTEEYEFTKADCTIDPTTPGGRWRFYAATSASATTYVLTVANGISLVGSDSENSCSIAYPSEFEGFEIELYRIENTEQELKLVTSVNGVQADEYGNVQVPTGGSARVLLWDEPQPRSFGAETIPLDLSGYDGIEVLFYEYDDSADNTIISSGYIPLDFRYKSDGSAYPLYGQGTLVREYGVYYRNFYIYPTNIEFFLARTTDDGDTEWYMIPYRIYGFKY